MTENDGSGRIQGRIESIDYFRGFTMILMISVNYLSGIVCIPGWLKHAPDIGLTITDLIAPAFLFAISLTYKISFDRRAAQDGLNKAYYHFIARFLAIAGIGAFFTGGAAIVAESEAGGGWGVLQAIGAAGLIALLFIRTNTYARFFAGFGLLAVYQLMLDKIWLTQVLSSAQGGLQASLSWGALLLISTALTDMFRNNSGKLRYAVCSAFILTAGIMSSLLFPISKHRVSFSYVLVSIGISALVFLCFYIFDRYAGIKLRLLEWWGKNSLFLYLVHMILLGVTFLPGSLIWYAEAPLWSALCQCAAFFSVICLIAWRMDKSKNYIKL